MTKNVITKDITAIETKLRTIGDELGIVLPKEVVQELNLEADDKVFLVKTELGSYQLTTQDDKTKEALETAQRILDRYPHAFKELAK